MTGGRRRSRRSPPRRQAADRVVAEVTVDRLGGLGDGIASHDGRPLYVPFSLPGERVRVRLSGSRGDGLAGEPVAVLEPAAARVRPPCPYFAAATAACGGCALQHMSPGAAADFKRVLVADALSRRNLDPAVVTETVAIEPGHRRRATFAVAAGRGAPAVGFHERDSHRVVAIDRCLALRPELAALPEPLSRLLAGVAAVGRGGSVAAAASDTGLDLVMRFGQEPGLRDRERIVAFAEGADIARISWQTAADEPPEPVVIRRTPAVTFSGTAVALPPGAFLQASVPGEQAIVRHVQAALAGRLMAQARLGDLFAGLGTLSFALAASGHVMAVEGDGAMAGAINQAAGRSGLGGRVGADCRDLFRQPLAGKELAAMDAIVFDPPRAGALHQVQAIAAARSPGLVVAVSCNPATFARDARVLADGGYRLESVAPIDQFPWSPHVELVAVLSR